MKAFLMSRVTRVRSLLIISCILYLASTSAFFLKANCCGPIGCPLGF